MPAGSEVGSAGVDEVTKVVDGVDGADVAGEPVGVSLTTTPPGDLCVSQSTTVILSYEVREFSQNYISFAKTRRPKVFIFSSTYRLK